MVRQSERSSSTIGAILVAARKLFAAQGFETTSIDGIAAKAGVAKGAVYHHFSSKEEIFTRVLTDIQGEIAASPVPAAARKIIDPLDQIADAVLRYLLTATEPPIRQILLIDGPAVIGWQRWREIDDRFFGAGVRTAMRHILGPKAKPAFVEAVSHILMGSVMEAALVCATAVDPAKTARELAHALRKLLEGLRIKA